MRAHLVAGLGFGDEGKGTITDYLVRRCEARLVVRYNGGPQAAHNVVTDDGKHHTFAQFGSGTFAGARTHLSKHMLVDPLALAREAQHLVQVGITDPMGLVTIDERALLVTPYHRAVNRIREHIRGGQKHGSCGVGVGVAREYALERPEDAPTVGDLLRPERLVEKLIRLRARFESTLEQDLPSQLSQEIQLLRMSAESVAALYTPITGRLSIVPSDYLSDVLDKSKNDVVFEGAQGVLLDQDYGFHPHTTWTDTTFNNAHELLRNTKFAPGTTRIGVMRSYMTRHGAGPLPTEQKDFDVSMDHNKYGMWQGSLRAGPLDLVLLDYAQDVLGSCDELVITHMDRVDRTTTLCHDHAPQGAAKTFYDGHRIRRNTPVDLAYQEGLGRAFSQCSPEYAAVGDNLICEVVDQLNTPVTVLSYGPRTADKRHVG